MDWYASIRTLWFWDVLPLRRVVAYRIQKLYDRRQALPLGVGARARQVGGA